MINSVRGAMTKEPISVAPDITLADAHEIMRSWGMRHLPVTKENGSIAGLLSERDIYRFMALNPGQPKATVDEAMSKHPYIVDATTRLADVAEFMAEEKIGCAVVRGTQGVMGIFTTTDALKILALLLRDEDSGPYRVMRLDEYLARAVA